MAQFCDVTNMQVHFRRYAGKRHGTQDPRFPFRERIAQGLEMNWIAST